MSSGSNMSANGSKSLAIPKEQERGRPKSNSISNAMLHHHRERGNEKKVSFSTFENNSSQIFTLTSNSSSDDDYHYYGSSELYPNDSHEGISTAPKGKGHQQDSYRKESSHSPPQHHNFSPVRKNSLKKLSSYPGERMGVSQSLDSQLLEGRNAGSSPLPEFNKRPLTDTPIVSGVASPVTRDQSSDYDETDDDEAKHDSPMLKTKNISHLNLTDLDDTSLRRGLKAPNPHENNKSESISPMTVNQPKKDGDATQADGHKQEDFQTLRINKEEKEDLLQDVPLDMKRQFEKTPSLEHLKNLLLTKPPPPARKTYTLNIPGQTSSKTSPDGHIASVDVGSKLVIVMVGLPARGKSYITNKLTRYLNWLQHDCRVFNVGNTRRKDKENNAGPETNPLPDTNTPNNETNTPPSHSTKTTPATHTADFFSPDNKSTNMLREKWAMDTLDQLLNYVIDGSGSVGIFDATNSTKKRRMKILKKIKERSKGELKVLFLESICSDPAIIESNIRLKLSGPDYHSMDPEVALKDFVGRLHNYEKAYETIDDAEESIPGFQYVKMIDVGKKVVSYNVQGFLASQTIYFLLNFNLCERQIWITRHGESVDNLSGRIGGDSNLTKRGESFARTLLRFMNFQRQEFRKQQLERFSTRLELRYNSIFDKENNQETRVDSIPSEPNFCVWTSMLYRAVETGQFFDEQLFSIKEMRMLNELGGGKFEGMTYNEIQNRYPKEFQSRLHNKLSYRYPGVGGESYLDVLTRLRPLITEIERTTDHLLIISHRVVLRILLAYFLNLDKSSIGELDVPLHTLYCLELKPYGTDYRMYEYDEGLDWFVKVEPEHQKNLKEVGVAFKERKYSVVPTAPPSSSSKKLKDRTFSNNARNSNSDAFSLRRSSSFGSRPVGNLTYSSYHNNDQAATGDQNSTTSNDHVRNRISSKKLEDLNKLRKP